MIAPLLLQALLLAKAQGTTPPLELAAHAETSRNKITLEIRVTNRERNVVQIDPAMLSSRWVGIRAYDSRGERIRYAGDDIGETVLSRGDTPLLMFQGSFYGQTTTLEFKDVSRVASLTVDLSYKRGKHPTSLWEGSLTAKVPVKRG